MNLTSAAAAALAAGLASASSLTVAEGVGSGDACDAPLGTEAGLLPASNFTTCAHSKILSRLSSMNLNLGLIQNILSCVFN